MEVKELEKQFMESLAGQYETEEIRGIFSLAIEAACGWSALQLKLNNNQIINEKESSELIKTLTELKGGKPIQHILHYAWFYGERFEVNTSVLIPRPETEELVEWILQTLKPNSSILDIGTGTGCIPITLNLQNSSTLITAIDVSPDAIATASRNATQLGAHVKFIEQDIFSYQPEQKFDIIVSNPPYITQWEKEEMHSHVLLHEPHLALFVSNEDPLRFYKAIAQLAQQALKNGAYLFFEINENLATEMVQMLEAKDFSNIELRKDMQGKDRMIRCQFMPV